MGYYCYITRKQKSFNKKDDILAAEWETIISEDISLTLDNQNEKHFAIWQAEATTQPEWLDWQDGSIYSKNPSKALRKKMFRIAQKLNAQLIGEEGELYAPDGEEASSGKNTFSCAIIHKFKNFFKKTDTHHQVITLPFCVGDRVQDPWCNTATVIKIDLEVEHGNGLILVKYDDGRETNTSAIAHGFVKITQNNGS